MQQNKLETGNDSDDDQINLKSASRSDVLSPSNESHRGTNDSPRRSQSKKKSLLAISAMFLFIGSIGTAVIWKNQLRDTFVIYKIASFFSKQECLGTRALARNLSELINNHFHILTCQFDW